MLTNEQVNSHLGYRAPAELDRGQEYGETGYLDRRPRTAPPAPFVTLPVSIATTIGSPLLPLASLADP